MSAYRILWGIGCALMLVAGILTLAACTGIPTPTPTLLPITLTAPEDVPTSTFSDPVLRQGEAQYNQWCGHCHGFNGEGQHPETIARTLELGMFTVPAHDSSGHTWQHPDQLLLLTIQRGVQNPLDQFPMPGFEGTLTQDEIMGVLAYIKLWWTDEQRAHQAEVTARWAETDRELGITTATPSPNEATG